MGNTKNQKGSVRRRWLVKTVSVAMALGLVGVLLITAAFGTYSYSNKITLQKHRAESATKLFAAYGNRSFEEFYDSCIAYARDFQEQEGVRLQFISAQGELLASSDGTAGKAAPVTPEISEAISARGCRHYLGKENGTGELVLAASGPVIYSNGEVIGVFRYVSSLRHLNLQIAVVAAASLIALAVITVVILVISNFYVQSVLKPVEEITETARRIAGGAYGIQIKNRYAHEVGKLADTINELSAQISQNEKMQTEFISSLSHELRTPLTAITGWSETLIGDENLDAETLRGIKVIRGEAQRLTEMVSDILDITKIQDGRMTLNVELSDLRGVFEDTVFMYGSRLAQDGITLEYLDNDDDIPMIPCDAKRLRQVFLNILDNAAKHGGEGKKIQASMDYEDHSVVVRIRDFGPGIPEDEIPLVKKKFYKGSSKARGTGIGLAVCDEIVQMHGGELTLENASDGGTLVTVTIPAAQ